MESKTKLLDQLRLTLRLQHKSCTTEDAYVHWVKRFILFHHKRHSGEMGAPEIQTFLPHLAVDGQVTASTQNVALQALLFLYRRVLKQTLPELDDCARAKRPRRVPVVLTREEVSRVLAHLQGTPHLMASLLYGAGLRLMECVRLRVQDLDFASHYITVRDGQGEQDRTTVLPQALERALQRQLVRVKVLHEEDLAAGCGSMYFPPRSEPSIHARVSSAGITYQKPCCKRP